MKIISICKNGEYRRVYSRGKSVVTSSLVVYFFKNRKGIKRVGITAGKKVGGAVKRNRARRIIREAVREILPLMSDNYDYVFVARGKTPYLKSTDIKYLLLKQFKKIGLLK